MLPQVHWCGSVFTASHHCAGAALKASPPLLPFEWCHGIACLSELPAVWIHSDHPQTWVMCLPMHAVDIHIYMDLSPGRVTWLLLAEALSQPDQLSSTPNVAASVCLCAVR